MERFGTASSRSSARFGMRRVDNATRLPRQRGRQAPPRQRNVKDWSDLYHCHAARGRVSGGFSAPGEMLTRGTRTKSALRGSERRWRAFCEHNMRAPPNRDALGDGWPARLKWRARRNRQKERDRPSNACQQRNEGYALKLLPDNPTLSEKMTYDAIRRVVTGTVVTFARHCYGLRSLLTVRARTLKRRVRMPNLKDVVQTVSKDRRCSQNASKTEAQNRIG
jgi:hypothetical protein